MVGSSACGPISSPLRSPNVKVLLIGTYPPPLGGVSVFIKRYKRQLESEGHTVDTLDPEKLTKAQTFAALLTRARRYDLISLHFPSLHIMLMLFVLGVAVRTEVGEHNWRVLENWSALERRFYAAFLRRARELLLVSPHLADYYRAHGVEIPARTRVRPPFIPPPADEEPLILETYSEDVRAFLARSRPLVVANGFRITFHEGVDLYGLDLCVELVARLKETYPRIGLLFALAEIGDHDYFQKIRARIAAQALEENFHVLTGQREIWPLFKRADLFVRPTYTDGYAISVAEALHFGCAVVASDAAERPPQVITFANRDAQDFQRKCLQALAARTAVKEVR